MERIKKWVSMILAILMVVSNVSVPVTAAQITDFLTDEPMAHGLQGDFYTVEEKEGFELKEENYVKTYVDNQLSWASAEDMLQKRLGLNEYVGARWTGKIVAPTTGDYTFYSFSDNGVRLYVEDMETPIIDWWVNQWDKEQTSTKVHLEAGQPYDFKMEWFEANGGSHLTLRWAGPDLEKSIITEDAFYLPDSFQGPIVTSINTENADLNADSLSGTIDISGKQLENATVEVVRMSGASLDPKVELEVVQNTDEVLTVNVPSDLIAGKYKLAISNNGILVNTVDSIRIIGEMKATMRTEHPRPDWKRSEWMNLNGWWDFTFDSSEVGKDEKWYQADKEYDQSIQVPFCWESPLSGVENASYLGQAWYRRNLNLDASWFETGKKLFINFGAVDWKSALYINDQEVGSHVGGYTEFEFDVTDYLKEGDNTIALWVEDKASYGDNSYPALVGKQGHNAPCGYTHTSGIWQTVYLESRDETYLEYAHATSDIDNSQVNYELKIQSAKEQEITVAYDFKGVLWNEDTQQNVENGSIVNGTQTIALQEGENIISLDAITIENQKLWNFNEANLYDGTIRLVDGANVLDEVETYFGQRKVETQKYDANEYEYIYVNDEPVFLSGLLDQGFWEDGVYTAPSEEALKYDIKAMRDRDFNMIRKHLKIEDPLQYYWCDRLGMFLWQDMPHATYMNATYQGDNTPGRVVYEEALEQMLDTNFNHPSMIAVMLFNETWGIDHNAPKAADGKNTNEWIQAMYSKTQGLKSDILVEDMSPCNSDHIQPTDLNTFHMYPKGYADSKNLVDYIEKNTFIGSGQNFIGGHKQEGEPWLNSEYGGVAAYDKDWDISWCFKYQTDIQRQYQKLNGFVYTEPYDVEYERNGILTYDRRDKIFGYDEVAYGGDMSINDLTQENYVGVDIDPAKQMKPGSTYTAPAVALNWSGDTFENAVLKWRFDATDVYGNHFTTNLSGEEAIAYKPYVKEEKKISFKLPSEKCVGTLTVWIEDKDGNKVAKNFVNVIVSNSNKTAEVQYLTDETVVLRRDGSAPKENTFKEGVGAITYEYQVPVDFNVDTLNDMRLIAEASSKKEATINHGISNSAAAQTTVGSERPSDMTVFINGHEVQTVLIPDNPRDIRGTLSLPKAFNGGTSAGDFGYLVNLKVSDDVLEQLKEELKTSKTLDVTYGVKEDAENKNGLRIYNENSGRYVVNPMLILNPTQETGVGTVETTATNYSVETQLNNAEALQVRGGAYGVKLEDGVLSLTAKDEVLESVEVGEGTHTIRVTLFDAHIQVYADAHAVPVIDAYGKEISAGTVTHSNADANIVVSAETYEKSAVEESTMDIQFVDHFNTNKDSMTQKPAENKTFATRYTLLKAGLNNPSDSDSEGIWNGSNVNDNLQFDLDWGNKAVLNDSECEDVIAEADITITDRKTADNPNVGFVIRGNEFQEFCDGANGYYAGLGIQTSGGDKNVPQGNGFVEVGNMHQGWTGMAKVDIGKLEYGETHRLRVVAVSNRIRVYLDDEKEPRVDLYDNTYSSGSIAIRGFNIKGSIDNVVISTAPRYDANFENNSIEEWEEQAGTWEVADGTVSTTQTGTLLVGNRAWTDYEVATSVMLTEDNASAGMAVRASGTQEKPNGYYVLLNAEEQAVQVVKVKRGIVEILDSSAMSIEKDKNYQLKARVVNNAIRVYVDEAQEALVTATDNDFVNGKAGLAIRNGAAKFDNFIIKDKFIYEENFYDGTLSGWNIMAEQAEVSNNTLNLSNKAKGDKVTDGYATWDNYVIEANVKLDVVESGKSNAGYVFRASDFTQGADNLRGYVLGLNYNKDGGSTNEQNGIEFGDLHYGWRQIKNTTEFEMNPEKWYNLKVEALGEDITVYVNGKKYYSVKDKAYVYGMFGIRNFNSGIQLKNLKITPEEEINNKPNPDTTDKSNLQALIDYAQTQKDSDEYKDVVPAVKKALEKAIEDAQSVVEDSKATQQEVDQAYTSLLKLVWMLGYTGNTSDLTVVVDLANEYDLTLYTPETAQAVRDALTTAELVLENENALQEEITKATEDLQSALDALKLSVDKTALKNKIDEADKIDLDLFLSVGKDNFVKALADAKAIYEKEDPSKQEVEDAYKALQNAIFLLREKPDKSKLEELIKDAQGKESAKYTPESFAVLTKALEAAKLVKENKEATKEEVAKAAEGLTKAIDGLVEKTDEIKEGWKEQTDGSWRYQLSDGTFATSTWKFIYGRYYYFNDKGYMVTGWAEVDHKWYYLKANGAMAIGWEKVDNKWYYLKANGMMATGWAKVDNKWYYLKANGMMETGWAKVDNKWYYLKANGMMATSWAKVDNKWYYLKANGMMATGWVKVDHKWYYLKANGAMASDWVKVSGKWYYLKANGVMATGWVKTRGTWYYLNKDGSMATGWTFDGKKTYYLNTVNGAWNGQTK